MSINSIQVPDACFIALQPSSQPHPPTHPTQDDYLLLHHRMRLLRLRRGLVPVLAPPPHGRQEPDGPAREGDAPGEPHGPPVGRLNVRAGAGRARRRDACAAIRAPREEGGR